MASAMSLRRERFTEGIKAETDALHEKLRKATLQSPLPAFGCGKPEYTSAASLPTCPELCGTCGSHYLPLAWREYPLMRGMHAHSDHEAAAEVQSLVSTINSNLAYTKSMIGQYGDTIMKRWQKRTVQKRADVLLTAMPTMCKQKWSQAHIHFEHRRKIDAAILRTAGKHFSATREALGTPHDMQINPKSEATHLLPYVDIPSLSQDPNLLLKLLHNRSESEPAEWVMFDYEQVKRVFDIAFHVPVAHNPHCVSMQSDSFGQLVQWESASAHRCDIIGYPRARIVLQTQAALTDLLRRCTQLILENRLDAAVPGRDKWNDVASCGFVDRSQPDTELARADQAFSDPPTFDLHHIVQMLESRCKASADHLWLLQVDPVYARHYLAQLEESHFYNSIDPQKQLELKLRRILHPIPILHMWQYLADEAKRALGVQARYPEHATSTPDYDAALRELQCTLEGQLDGMIAALKSMVVQSDILRNYLKPGANGKLAIKIKKREEIFRKDPILWNIIELFEHDHRYALDSSWHIAFIDDILAHASPKERARIDSVLYEHMSDMSAVSDAILALKHRRPNHGPKLDVDQYHATREGNKAFDKLVIQLRVAAFYAEECKAAFCPPLEAFLGVPMPSSKISEESCDRRSILHKKLCYFWSVVRIGSAAVMVGPEGDLSSPELQDYLKPIWVGTDMFERELNADLRRVRTLALVRSAKEQEKRAKQGMPVAKLTQEHTGSAQSTWGSVSGEASRRLQLTTKQKQKTRPENTEHVPEAEQEIDETPASATSIAVAGTSFVIFTRMLLPGAENKGNVRWEHFVAAVVDAGCSVTHNGGSAVTIKDESHGEGGAIVVHRPHPNPSVDHVMLRTIGKRLRKWFGWDADTFVERC